MHSPEDSEVRALFEDLRRQEAARVPGFALPRRADSQSAPRAGWRAGATFALFVILLLTIVVIRSRPARQPVPVAMSGWKAPTDFLLDTPQSKFLRTVPQFGVRKGTL